MSGKRRRIFVTAQDRPQTGRSWYRIVNLAEVAEIYIYDEIGYWGITAGDFINELAQITAPEIAVHLNTPGGEVFDGIAIRNALEVHQAKVTVYVDALAASIGSVIAQAGDWRVMGRNSQMMIHKAFALTIGDEQDHLDMAALLAKQDDNIADIYARRSGTSTKAQWLKAMSAETWYSAEEAVEAGLADEVTAPPERREDMPENRWDLSIFTYAGRAAAPAPPAFPAAANDAGGENQSGAGAGAGPAADTTDAPATGGVVDPAAAAAVAEGDCTFKFPDGVDVAALFTGAIADAAAPPVIPIAGADVAALIDHEANHRPATPTVTTRDPDTGPTTIDPIAFATALKEGLK